MLLLAKYYHLDEKLVLLLVYYMILSCAYKYNEDLKKLNPDYLSRVNVKRQLKDMHGFVHAQEAANNSLKYFPELIDDKIYSCIKTHMFPLNIMPPKYPEGWIITCMDKKLSANVIKEIKYLPGMIKDKVTSKETNSYFYFFLK